MQATGIKRWLGVASVLGMAAAGSQAASARDLTYTGWGGAGQEGQRKVILEPFSKETGIKIVEDSWDGGIGVLRTKAQGTPVWDLVQVEADELVLGCEEGIFEEIDWASVGGKEKFLPEAVHECGVGVIVWSTVLAYDGAKLGANGPKTWADFFDTAKFPGKRALRKGPRQAFEFATMAQGVPPEKVYEALKAPGGVDKAFAMLDKIKPDLLFWESGSQPTQLLASGEVAMTSAYNGRITAANRADKKDFKIGWEAGYVYQLDSMVVLKGSPQKANAEKLLAAFMQPERQAAFAEALPYGPTRIDAQVAPAIEPDLPSGATNLPHGLFFDREFWVENNEVLTERFNAWASQK